MRLWAKVPAMPTGGAVREKCASRDCKSYRRLCHVSAPPVDSDDQAALAEEHRGAPHGVVGHPAVAG
jgi:hypothetical protein